MQITFVELKVLSGLLQGAMEELTAQGQMLAQKDQEIAQLKASLKQVQAIQTTENTPNGHNLKAVEGIP